MTIISSKLRTYLKQVCSIKHIKRPSLDTSPSATQEYSKSSSNILSTSKVSHAVIIKGYWFLRTALIPQTSVYTLYRIDKTTMGLGICKYEKTESECISVSLRFFDTFSSKNIFECYVFRSKFHGKNRQKNTFLWGCNSHFVVFFSLAD